MTDMLDNIGDTSPKAHYGRIDDNNRLTADEMDERRRENVAYEYLCRLEEAKLWIEACICEILPSTIEFEEHLQNGVFLAKVAHFISPNDFKLKKIFDKDLTRYEASGLHFRHTDNINFWLQSLKLIGMPKDFYPETTDIYSRKNIPRAIYCIHALSLFLFKIGRAPKIQSLYGKIQFTEEEICAMRKELDKYGIQMPAFHKIGGILADEMPVDEAALHAAIIAINEAIDREIAVETTASLRNEAANLVNISDALTDTYQRVLKDAKVEKLQAAIFKIHGDCETFIPDVYDELLTQSELQSYINRSNMNKVLEHLHMALRAGDSDDLSVCLRAPALMLRDYNDGNAPFYLESLNTSWMNKKNSNNNADSDDETHTDMLTKVEVQSIITEVNESCIRATKLKKAVFTFNRSLSQEDPEVTIKALHDPALGLTSLPEFASHLYHQEFVNIKAENDRDLEYSEIMTGSIVLKCCADINECIELNDSVHLATLLTADSAFLMEVTDQYSDKYLKRFRDLKIRKISEGDSDLLSHNEIQACVYDVNQKTKADNDRVIAVQNINEAIGSNDPDLTYEALSRPEANIVDLDVRQTYHYHQLLDKFKTHKAKESNDDSALLWFEEIVSTVNIANEQTDEGVKMSLIVKKINEHLAEDKTTETLDTNNNDDLESLLFDADIYFTDISRECIELYHENLQLLRKEKMDKGDHGSGWIMNRNKQGFKLYYNCNDDTYYWHKTSDMVRDFSLITREEIQACLTAITLAYNREKLFYANEGFVILLQAQCRGFIARRALASRLRFFSQQIPNIIMIQRCWRNFVTRRNEERRLQYLKDNEPMIIKIQSQVRMHFTRNKYQDRLNFFIDNVNSIVKIQAFMRSNWAQHDYKALMQGENPPLSVVRKFVHLLDVGEQDYDEEIAIQGLRTQVVSEVRSNKRLEMDVRDMDIKIGLLVKNRITLQDVVRHHKKMKEYNTRVPNQRSANMLRDFSQQSHSRLEAYQHLFYLLQTQPRYLASLIFEMPQSTSTKFMESVILTIYNFASNQREHFLLVNLFKTALTEEIKKKVDTLTDLSTGNPLVIKMIVGFNRNNQGQALLKELLNPLVRNVLDSDTVQINTNAIEVYKNWVNKTEMETGRPSKLPYDVTKEEALKHPEVVESINESMDFITSETRKFLVSIMNNVDLIPYCMRYMAKVLRTTLRQKFPAEPDSEIMKIVGNLIYYRYLNSAIVSPDAFDIIDVTAASSLSDNQRRSLASVGKILQFSVLNKGFGGVNLYMEKMNKDIIEFHSKFANYFNEICDVAEPEVYFNVDQYTDVVKIAKPSICITLGEIANTHKLLLQHQEKITFGDKDPLNEILSDLGDIHDIEAMFSNIEDDSAREELEKSEITLVLNNKFEVPEQELNDVTNLMTRLKRMIVDIIRCQKSGDNLVEVLNLRATSAEEAVHQALISQRAKTDKLAKENKSKLIKQKSLLSDNTILIEAMKIKILALLDELESRKAVSKENLYQTVVNSIVQDIRNQRLYRKTRRQEMTKLKSALKNLSFKRYFFQEQIDYYNQYLKTCLSNLSTKGTKSEHRKSTLFKRKSSSKATTIKYSASKLHEKGIVLEIQDLNINQFKNVLFEISSTDETGLFHVNAKFMGITMDRIDLKFEDLLRLQYEGVTVMKMFDKAKVNVNLLVFLLNKKFYGK